MSSLCYYPLMSAHKEDTEPDRIARLHEAFGVMCSIARLVWREEAGGGTSGTTSTQNCWDGALLALRDTQGHLEGVWASPPHQERFGMLAELAWEAVSEPRSNVLHRLPT